MSTLTRRDYRPFTGIADWLELPWTVIRPVSGHVIRIEDYVQEGRYVLRAELPGIDPESDLEVTLTQGILTIKAERREKTEGKHRSEFRYGAFTRSVTLPEDADEEHIQACYDNGILELSVSLKDHAQQKAQRRIPVMLNKHIKPT